MSVIAFIADTHDHIDLVTAHLETVREYDVDEIVHLGDVCEPETLNRISREDGVTTHWITGNGDESRKHDLNNEVERWDGHAHGYNEKLQFGEKLFLCRHGMEHNLSYKVAATDEYIDYVFHGHWHYQERTEVGDPPDHGGVVFNPGQTGLYLYDTESDSFEHVSHDVTVEEDEE